MQKVFFNRSMLIFSLTVAFLLLVISFATLAAGYLEITGAVVNVRKGPATSYAKLAQVQKGEVLAFSQEKDGWYKVILSSGEEGWVIADYAKVVEDAGRPQTLIELPTGYKQGSVNANQVNVREGPATSYTSLTKVNFGDKVAIYQRQDNWFKVLTQTGVSGWISSAYVSLADAQLLSYTPQASHLPVFDGGGRLSGQATVQVRQTSYGLDIEIASDEVILPSLAAGKKSLELTTDLELDLQEEGSQDIELATVGSQTNRLLISADSGLYYKASFDQEHNTYTLQVSLNPVLGKIIYIDPGHGNYVEEDKLDVGAIGVSGLYEMDVNYPVALRVAELLKQAGADVRLTRGQTTYIALAERAYLANAAAADIFVSLHCNSSTGSQTNGVSTWTYAPTNNDFYDRQDRLFLANCLQEALLKTSGLADFSVREDNFAVTRETIMTAALVEMGFLSNPSDEALLKTDAFREKLAQGVFNGITNYFAAK